MADILLVEDESSVASLIIRSLNDEGHTVSLAPDGTTGLQMVTGHEYDLVILDVMLPGINGLDLCRRIRDNKITTPILILTALGTTQNIVAGLDSGADDYLVKPYKLAELQARTRSLLRRGVSNSDVEAIVDVSLKISDLELDINEKVARRSGRKIDLTPTEYRLLKYLMTNQRKVLSRMEILEQVWGVDFNMNTKVVDVYVNYIRKKVDAENDNKLIHTVVGMGYIMKEN